MYTFLGPRQRGQEQPGRKHLTQLWDKSKGARRSTGLLIPRLRTGKLSLLLLCYWLKQVIGPSSNYSSEEPHSALEETIAKAQMQDGIKN